MFRAKNDGTEQTKAGSEKQKCMTYGQVIDGQILDVQGIDFQGINSQSQHGSCNRSRCRWSWPV